MRYRKKISRRASKRLFNKTARKVHKANVRNIISRGGKQL